MSNPPDYVKIQREGHKGADASYEEATDESPARARQLSTWIKRAKLPAASILDAGCRMGVALEEFTFQFPQARVVGLDIVPEFVASASLCGDVLVGDIQDLPFKDREFDWVFCSSAIEHCPNIDKAKQELFRVSNVGCMIYTDLETRESFDSHPFHYVYHHDPAEWVDVLRDPDFWLMSLTVPRHTRISLLWLRKEYATKYNANYSTPLVENL